MSSFQQWSKRPSVENTKVGGKITWYNEKNKCREDGILEEKSWGQVFGVLRV